MLQDQLATRWDRLRHRVLYVLIEQRRHRSSPGARVWPLRREYGGWAIRPERGWRALRWITPPLHYTRQIPASDKDAATDWAMERLDIG
ncbi:hypothetical protein [Nocardia sp. XZ_19_231]|uniref:hypothetical protein n=1 Tax=Nocardia sp. XZ_19_231 TaxID=2769252 RepID=UPI00188ECE65|nr:hypothetical protein [Nocardia sp. XZ_19_231]